MEADWEVEVGGEAPVIEARWPGLVDLERAPGSAWHLPETAQLPALADTLAKLNRRDSPVWTSKCDVWPVAEFDPDELDAAAESAHHAIASYIDLLPRNGRIWAIPSMAVSECKRLCACLSGIPLRCCRVDFIVRRANIAPDQINFGITAYLTACGPTPGEASASLAAALAALSDSIVPTDPPESAASKLQ